MDTETNPDVEDVTEVEDVNDAPEDDTTELDEYGNPVEEPDDDSEEIEHEGQKLRIPKAAKPLLMFQADYTRKTQELAESRKALEQRVTSFNEVSEGEKAAQQQLAMIDGQLAQYQQIDWQTWSETDPFEAQKAFMAYQQLQQGRAGATQQLTQAQRAREAEAQRITAERIQQGAAELARDIPGWNQDKAKALLDFGQKQYGLSRSDLDGIDDPRLIKVLHDAFEYRRVASKQSVKQKVETVQKVQPATKVGGASPPSRAPSPKDDINTWMKKRDAQTIQRN